MMAMPPPFKPHTSTPKPMNLTYTSREGKSRLTYLMYAVAFSMNMLSIFLPPMSLALKP